jgi:hypothetical protein
MQNMVGICQMLYNWDRPFYVVRGNWALDSIQALPPPASTSAGHVFMAHDQQRPVVHLVPWSSEEETRHMLLGLWNNDSIAMICALCHAIPNAYPYDPCPCSPDASILSSKVYQSKAKPGECRYVLGSQCLIHEQQRKTRRWISAVLIS